jgi:soluble lytic murein transglycosylase-like protein
MNRSTPLMIAIAALLFFPCQRAAADIYQYIDDAGVIHFSNVSVGKAKKFKKVSQEPNTRRYAENTSRTAPAPSAQAPSTSIPASSNMPGNYTEIINSACNRHGVDPALVHAIVKVESDFNPYALSSKGAMGLMQLMPQTAMDMNVRNTYNPHENIDGGVKYLRYLIDRYEGNLALALAAYNAGETSVKKWGTIPPFPETQNYVQKILRLYNGTGISLTPHYTTIYTGYGDDGALIFTDDPSRHTGKDLKRKNINRL